MNPQTFTQFPSLQFFHRHLLICHPHKNAPFLLWLSHPALPQGSKWVLPVS